MKIHSQYWEKTYREKGDWLKCSIKPEVIKSALERDVTSE